MHDGFVESFFHIDHKILGYKLKPLSCGHVFALSAAGCPVLSNKPFTTLDILFFLKTCASDVVLRNGCWLPDTDHKITVLDKFNLGRLAVDKRAVERICEKILAYTQDYTITPDKLKDPTQAPGTLTAPDALAVAMSGVELFGEQRAWTMPYATLITSLEVYYEGRGYKIRFAPDAETLAEYEEMDRIAEENGKRILEALERGKS